MAAILLEQQADAIPADLPRHDLIAQGLRDLAAGLESAEAMLFQIGAPRLAGLGLQIPERAASPEHGLYHLLARDGADSAHARYNALIRRLVSFERAAECVKWRAGTRSTDS
ncbi:MAG: hypothetical protein HY291_06675 [Planctomycetes bacterium]|nr:hypothetical protein [Planctomycetota bacterium]